MHTHRCHGLVIGVAASRPSILGLNLKKKKKTHLTSELIMPDNNNNAFDGVSFLTNPAKVNN